MLGEVNGDGSVPDCSLIDEIVRESAGRTPADTPETEVGTPTPQLAAT
ncbi:hypothetical protein ACFC4G_25610 [Streptomyces sp. NPDC056002]